jgi:hypothetical protein
MVIKKIENLLNLMCIIILFFYLCITMQQINKDDLLCPITQQIFLHPVMTQDGYTYEREVIVKWLKTHDISPMTNVPLRNKILVNNISIKQIVDKYIDINHEEKSDQYKNNAPTNTIHIYFCELMDKLFNKNKQAIVKPKFKNIHDGDYEENITCQITKKIYFDPVTTCDGCTYEKEAICKWLNKNNTDPIKNNKLSDNKLIKNILVRQIVENITKKDPEKLSNQYKCIVVNNKIENIFAFLILFCICIFPFVFVYLYIKK